MKNLCPCTSIMVVLAMVLCTSDIHAQAYEHAAGIRAGYSSGLTYKGFFRHSNRAMEADFYYNNHGLNLAVFYSWNFELSRSSRFFFYTGTGIMGGQWDDTFSSGICGQAGIMHLTRKVPLNFSLEWRPMFNLYRQTDYDLLDFGIIIRYRFSI